MHSSRARTRKATRLTLHDDLEGKRFALCMQATVETVIKVSGNKRPEVEVVPDETPAPVSLSPDAEPNTFNSIIHHSWGHLHDRKAIPEVHFTYSPVFVQQLGWCLLVQ